MIDFVIVLRLVLVIVVAMVVSMDLRVCVWVLVLIASWSFVIMDDMERKIDPLRRRDSGATDKLCFIGSSSDCCCCC